MRVKRYIVLLLVLSSLLVGCATPAPAAPKAAQQATSVTVAQPTPLPANVTPKMVEELRAAGEIVIVDVREADEYAMGRIPGSMWIPLGELAGRTNEVPSDVPVVMVCRSGNRSAEAVKILQKAGFTNVHNMTGGMIEWTAAGYVPVAER